MTSSFSIERRNLQYGTLPLAFRRKPGVEEQGALE